MKGGETSGDTHFSSLQFRGFDGQAGKGHPLSSILEKPGHQKPGHPLLFIAVQGIRSFPILTADPVCEDRSEENNAHAQSSRPGDLNRPAFPGGSHS